MIRRILNINRIFWPRQATRMRKCPVCATYIPADELKYYRKRDGKLEKICESCVKARIEDESKSK